MRVLKSHITIGKYEFDFVHELRIETSWMTQTQKGTIILPAALKFDIGTLKSEIKKGDEVTIKIGYDDHPNTIFTGFVARLKPSIPVVIEVEDAMWKLKQIEVNDTAKDESLKSFLERNIPYEVDCFDINIYRFVASKITASQLLNELKNDYGFYSFFKNGKLVVGKQYDPANYTTQILEMYYNILEDNLEYKTKDDVKIKVTAISNMADGTKHEVELGDPEGESRSLNFYNLPKAELTKIATKEIERLSYDGYRGDITIFGEPFFQIGDVAEIRNAKESDKTGRYWVDAVDYSFGVNGYRQTITLGSRT